MQSWENFGYKLDSDC